jgi:hypothetical protein
VKAIGPGVVERTWKRMASLTYDDVILKTQRIGAEQPHVLAYLFGVDDEVLCP